MKKISFIQGSKEWLEYRATTLNASDAPAMLGISKYKTRAQLLRERTTGIVPEVDAATQIRFNDGHRFEALARPIAEQIIGEELSPVTGRDGEFSASFDGITFDNSVIFEHKTLNDGILKAMGANGNTGGLDEQYRAQMEQQLMVSCADKCLFMASKFEKSDDVTDYAIELDGGFEYYNLIQEVHGWYLPDHALRARIVAGWAQFEKDLAAYVEPEVIDTPEADPIKALPAVVIQVSGELTNCNLAAVTPKFDMFLAKAEEGKTNISIHNGTAIAQFSRAAAVDCKLTAKAVVSQMATVSDAVATLELYAKKFDAMGLAYEKEVDRLKEIEKTAALNKARAEYAEHVAGLQAEISKLRLNIRLIVPDVDFALAIKGLKTVESKNNALRLALANGKIAADAKAHDLRVKIVFMENRQDYAFLFPDLQQLVAKPLDDFSLAVTTRIEKHKADEVARLESERVRIQAEEEAKARAKVITEAAQGHIVDANKMAEKPPENLAAAAMRNNPPPLPLNVEEVAPEPTHPGDDILIQFISEQFNVRYGAACNWVIETAERIKGQHEHIR